MDVYPVKNWAITIDFVALAKLKIKSKQKPPWRTEDIINLKKWAECKWRKAKLQVHYDILKEHLTLFKQSN